MLVCASAKRRIPATDAPSGIAAVNFNGSASLALSALGSIASPQFFSFVGWFKTDWTVMGKVAWVVDPSNNYPAWFATFDGKPSGQFYTSSGANPSIAYDYNYGFDTGWNHVIFSAETDLGTGAKKISGFVNRTNAVSKVDAQGSFTMAYGGLPVWVGSDGSGFFNGDMCDVSIWPGVSFLDGSGVIPSATLDLFITSALKWVDPATAIASLGTPQIMLSGDAGSFANNTLGSAGALSVNAGSLSDASTLPPQ